MHDRIGQQLGKYRLMRRLGHGGFGEVYLGEHVHLKTQAAIKVLYQVQLPSEEEVKFRKEAADQGYVPGGDGISLSSRGKV